MSCGAGGPVLEMFVGDLLPSLIADAKTCDGPVDFTGWTLTFEMRGPVAVTGLATGSSLGVLTHVWLSGQTATPGDYEVLFHGISPAPESKPRTFPVQGVLRISTP